MAIDISPNIKKGSKPRRKTDLYELSIDRKMTEKKPLSKEEIERLKERLLHGTKKSDNTDQG